MQVLGPAVLGPSVDVCVQCFVVGAAAPELEDIFG